VTVYTIWDQVPVPPASTSFIGTLGTDFSLSQAANLTGIWYYSADATHLGSACAIYDVNSTSIVAGTLNSSPSWSGTTGWIKCTYGGTVTLAASVSYAVAVYFSATVSYASGFSWPVASGIIGATDAAYDVGGALAYPETPAPTTSYFIDVEVTTIPPPNVPPVLYSMRSYP